MTELAPTQVALRELLMLTKCYCVSYGVGEHPRLGHNCSFRPDVETLIRNIGAALEMTAEGKGDGVWSGYVDAGAIRAVLLGLPAPQWPSEEGPSTDDPPWRTEEGGKPG